MAKIGFIGMGNIGYAIMRSLLNKYKTEDITFTDLNRRRVAQIEKETGVKAVDTNQDCAENAKYIVLAIKPQFYADHIQLALEVKAAGQVGRPVGQGLEKVPLDPKHNPLIGLGGAVKKGTVELLGAQQHNVPGQQAVALALDLVAQVPGNEQIDLIVVVVVEVDVPNDVVFKVVDLVVVGEHVLPGHVLPDVPLHLIPPIGRPSGGESAFPRLSV